jgi:hypothetical protein
MRRFLAMLRKKLFGGYSDQEMAEEHKIWREGVHEERGLKQRSIAEAYYSKKQSNEAFAVAEETAKILSGDLEIQKRVRDRIDRKKSDGKDDGKGIRQ